MNVAASTCIIRPMKFAREGWPFVIPFLIAAALSAALGRLWGVLVFLGLGVAVLLFFRDPKRSFAGDVDVILAPADGVVTKVDEVEDPALGEDSFTRIVTFLSAFDVHVQRAPTRGTVVVSTFRQGKKVAAFLDHADTINQWHLTVVERENGERVGIRQIAGLIARRVVGYLKDGESVERGQLLGVIKFGSRVDLMVPTTYEILVEKGQRLRNGETPVARAVGTS